MAAGGAPVCFQKLQVQKRTEGDGMENTDSLANREIVSGCSNETDKLNLIDKLIYRPRNSISAITPPDIQGQIVHLLPKHVKSSRSEGNHVNVLGTKEPKFIPYEPYKAAVKPIIPYEKHKRKKSSRMTEVHRVKPSVNLNENNILQIAADNTNSVATINVKSTSSIPDTDICSSQESQNSTPTICSEDNKSVIINDEEIEKTQFDFEADRKGMEEELKRLKEENGQLESQLKFQAQVNGELKNLLVAAMGEDLETRVHLLTEDKLHLARALLNSAQKLSTHQEQTEYLAGQCEVWRSKFLASSLMVEDLAKWKAALCQKASELQETMKRILDERGNVRDSLIHSHKELTLLCDKFDLTDLKGGRKLSGLKSSNVVDMATLVQSLSFHLRLQLLGDVPNSFSSPDLKGLESSTPSERHAEQLLLHPLALFGKPDAACSAVLGAAVALGVGQMHSTPAPACCPHCSGEVKMM